MEHEINPDILMLFDKLPAAFPIYEAAEAKILEAFPATRVKVGKTQVSFYNKYLYAALWPPPRKIKGRPEVYVGLTFGLGHQIEHPRIAVAVEPYPGRWTHHVLLAKPGDMDEQAMDWVGQAYEFSLYK